MTKKKTSPVKILLEIISSPQKYKLAVRLGGTLNFFMGLPLHFWKNRTNEDMKNKKKIHQNIEKESLCQPLIEVSLEIKQNLQKNVEFDNHSYNIFNVQL